MSSNLHLFLFLFTGLAPPTDREPPNVTPDDKCWLRPFWVEVQMSSGGNWMVDETGGDGGRNGTGGDGGNADRRAVNFNLPFYEQQSITCGSEFEAFEARGV